ncbi:cyclic pyranopterin monophosphate synthase MoaC [Desulfonatronum thioautotrophicum]|uniref:cyclic pyranopterin monophosphate synthase MoaC n=1 Tax=Desulfonatronum thioautotrophicum TaxID=617001 RepID=UPI0005EBD532|nr:cyclic pyranopterin monophosphate synthase MoaC [Desulfonatronum thioautotrophicum]
MNETFSHLTEDGELTMVDVGAKEQTQRLAMARGEVILSAKTLDLLMAKALPKGDVLATAKIAGIMAAKRTADMIPLCHSLNLAYVDLRFNVDVQRQRIVIESEIRCLDRTGAEMEALTAVQMAALTIYDMCKAVQKDIVIGPCRLIHKSGGRGGTYDAVPVDDPE